MEKPQEKQEHQQHEQQFEHDLLEPPKRSKWPLGNELSNSKSLADSIAKQRSGGEKQGGGTASESVREEGGRGEDVTAAHEEEEDRAVASGAEMEGGGCDEEDPLALTEPTSNSPSSQAASSSDSPTKSTTLTAQAPAASSKSPGLTRSKRSWASRLEELAKPKMPPPEPALPELIPPARKKKKPVRNMRPSLLLRLKPTNLAEAMERFFASDFQEPPKFTYAYPEEYVTQHFQENSNVCFELLPDAKRIMQRVQDELGGPVAFMDRLYGDHKISAEKHRDTVLNYVKDLGLEEKVNVRIVDDLLSAANVVKPSPDEKYIVNVCSGSVAGTMVQGICDHEVGTHLLRMMNDEHQVWHGARERYKLINPWTTEEGFATLNTYQSMPCKLLYPQALRYWAVCRGAQLGFVELFHELEEHVPDHTRRWQMCCRIKRGMIDTSLPGAFYMDQAYFKGAVEILRHYEEIDFSRLYGGQIALQDLDKVFFLLRKEVVRLPKFMNSTEKLRIYKSYCRRLIKENQIEIATERICKPFFIRTRSPRRHLPEVEDSDAARRMRSTSRTARCRSTSAAGSGGRRRAHRPPGLPLGPKAALTAAAASIVVESPSWKPVPVKVLKLDL